MLRQNNSMKPSIIIPALNEAEGIGPVLRGIPKDFQAEILVIDGGSEDETIRIAEAEGARVILEPQRGYGRACAAGVKAARGEVLVFMDADGADDPGSLPHLLAPIKGGSADLVLGSRLSEGVVRGSMPWHQYAGNWLAAVLIRWFYELPITDLSPFRAVIREVLLDLEMQEMTYGWPTEMIVKAARQGYRIQEIPVRHHSRLGGKSKISGTLRGTILATYFILYTIFKYSREPQL
jgi:glycosyltransferase involved in cell wall biosynthesis